MITLKACRNIILNTNGEMKSNVKQKMDELMKSSCTQITCVGQSQNEIKTPLTPHSPSDEGKNRPNIIDIEILGQWDAVERARLKCLVLLDELVKLSSIFF